MQHFNVLSMVAILLISTWSFTYFRQKSQRFSDSGLNYFLGYLIVFNLFAIETFFRLYFQNNVDSPTSPGLQFLINEIELLIRSVLILGMFIFEYKMIAWQREKNVPKWFIPALFSFLGCLITLPLLARKIPNCFFKGLYIHFWNIYTWPLNLLVIIFLIRLFRESRKRPETKHRSTGLAFAWLFLIHIMVQVVLAFLDALHLQFWSLVLAKLLFVYTNLIPILWLNCYYIPWAGSIGKIIGKHINMSTFQRTHSLSQREVEILSLIIDGKSYKEIETMLFISIHTVKSHVYNLYRKMGVKSRHQLIHKIITSQEEIL